MSGGNSRWPHLASRHDITMWAQRVDAPPELPRLVRRLIDQTNDQVVELQMRTDEGTRLAGYDGYSRALRGTPFVPEGAAVWEMGTAEEPKGSDSTRAGSSTRSCIPTPSSSPRSARRMDGGWRSTGA